MLKAYPYTEDNPAKKKPNEDRFGIEISESGRVVNVLVADGVTQPCDAQGTYPENSARAAELCVEGFKGIYGFPNAPEIRRRIQVVNDNIRAHNQRIGRYDMTDWEHRDRVCTTLAFAALYEGVDGRIYGRFAYVGDAVILSVSPEGMKMISCDQLAACHRYGKSRGWETNAARLAWQRGYVRNNPWARGEGNPECIGFGVLDGNPMVRRFVSLRSGMMQRGKRIILASDAIRVLAHLPNSDDTANYEKVADIVRNNPSPEVPERIVRLIRETEAAKGARSDDATVVVVGSE